MSYIHVSFCLRVFRKLQELMRYKCSANYKQLAHPSLFVITQARINTRITQNLSRIFVYKFRITHEVPFAFKRPQPMITNLCFLGQIIVLFEGTLPHSAALNPIHAELTTKLINYIKTLCNDKVCINLLLFVQSPIKLRPRMWICSNKSREWNRCLKMFVSRDALIGSTWSLFLQTRNDKMWPDFRSFDAINCEE